MEEWLFLSNLENSIVKKGNNKCNRRYWSSKEWKDKRKELIKPDTICVWCGSKDRLALHHLSNETYMECKNTIILCRKCHAATISGRKLCPVCKKSYTHDWRGVCPSCIVLLSDAWYAEGCSWDDFTKKRSIDVDGLSSEEFFEEDTVPEEDSFDEY